MDIVLYMTPSGNEPFKEWFYSLETSIQERILSRISRLELGHFGNAKALKDGLFELKFRSPALRIYYAMTGRSVVLLISGGDKRMQKKDIQKAKEYLVDHRRRNESKGK